MSLMAELGQGRAPAMTMSQSGAASFITGARPQIHQHQSQVSPPNHSLHSLSLSPPLVFIVL